jgi:hypothetical protein
LFAGELDGSPASMEEQHAVAVDAALTIPQSFVVEAGYSALLAFVIGRWSGERAGPPGTSADWNLGPDHRVSPTTRRSQGHVQARGVPQGRSAAP